MNLNQPAGDSTTNEQVTSVSAMVNPVQVPTTNNFTPSFPQTYQQPSESENYEKRIRDLMSAKDRALTDASRAQQRSVELQQQLESQQTQHSQLIEGATKATESLLQAKQHLEQQQQQLSAENLKLKLLAQQPDLLPYAEFIPASTVETDIKTAIERFRAAQLAAQPKAPIEVPTMRGLYPSNQSTPIPAAQPAAVPVPQLEDSLADFTQRVKNLELLDPQTRATKFIELTQEAEALARRQFNQ